MAERFKAAVLKTVGSERGPGVRIPLPPPFSPFQALISAYRCSFENAADIDVPGAAGFGASRGARGAA
jgi:hypothetical protein